MKSYAHMSREELERRYATATGRERERILNQLEKLGKRENADTRPRGKDAETR